MLVIAFINFDYNKLVQTTYPTDIDGRLCTMDNDKYNYLYFTSPTDTVSLNLIDRKNVFVFKNALKVTKQP